MLQGHDVIVGAQTGTGKTASFALPIMQLLVSRAAPRKKVRVLVLAPTRELAAQVEESFRSYGRHLALKSTVVFGGVNINAQTQALKRNPEILVATPGRLLDHLRSRTVDLSGVEILVLDEADRMLDMGFIHDIRKVLEALPKQRQNLFFSATFSKEIRQLADSFLRSPVEIAVARDNATAERIRQIVHPVDKGRKRALLSYLIGSGDWRQVLVFTRTKHGANRLAEQLSRDGINAVAIHGNKSQNARTRALAEFKRGDVRALVATDIAARGLDIEQLPHVVNYELPNVPEDYVHRIGRTGRAGLSGVALSLVCGEELDFLRGIERMTGKRIERTTVAGFEPGSAVPAGESTSADHEPARRQPSRRRSPRTESSRRGSSRQESSRSEQPPRVADTGGGGRKRRRSRGGNGNSATADAGGRGEHGSRGRHQGGQRAAEPRQRGDKAASAAAQSARKPVAGSLQNAVRAVAALFTSSSRDR